MSKQQLEALLAQRRQRLAALIDDANQQIAYLQGQVALLEEMAALLEEMAAQEDAPPVNEADD